MELQTILMTIIAFSAMLTVLITILTFIFIRLLSLIKENQQELRAEQKEIKSRVGRIEPKLNQ